MKPFTKKTIKYALILLAVIIAYTCIVPLALFEYGKNRIYVEMDDVEEHKIGIVFGAAINNRKQPSDMLKDRLITTAELYHAGKIQKILVSGDNRFLDYNEPEVMKIYLVEKQNVNPKDVVADYAGRRTYDTCIRAKNIWAIDKALLVTQGYHLPRAIYTCNQVGIEAKGVSATRMIYGGDLIYKIREILALHKAFIDLYFFPPEYVGGEMEEDFV